jgi:hypothetical protein
VNSAEDNHQNMFLEVPKERPFIQFLESLPLADWDGRMQSQRKAKNESTTHFWSTNRKPASATTVELGVS